MDSDKSNRRLAWFLLASIVLHLIFFLVKWDYFSFLSSDSHKKITPNNLNKITLMDPSVAKQIIERVKKQNKKRARAVSRQIVNNEATGREEKTKDTRFLGEKNQSYDRQTIAKDIGIFKKAGIGTQDGNADKNKNKDKGKGQLEKQHNQKKIFKLSDLSLGNVKVNSPTKKTKLVNGYKKRGLKRGDANSIGDARNNDFIEDVPLGDVTNLNTIEFKYYGFYHRIRQKLEQHWGNTLREKAKRYYAGGRRMPANENFITSLRITIDHRGEITRVKVLGRSGIRELDEAAVESFNKAGPFPNPPKGLLKNGSADIEWGFVVKS